VSRSTKLLVITTLALLVYAASSCSVAPARADQALPKISVEDATTHLHTIDVTVGNTFSVDIWTRDLPEPGMVDLRFALAWDKNLTSLASREVHDHGFGVLSETAGRDRYELEIVSPFPHSGFTDDASWLTLTFQCSGEGSSQIVIAYAHGYNGDYGHELHFSPENGVVNQHHAPAPSLASSLDRATALMPEMAVVALVCIIVVAALVTNRRRRRNESVKKTQKPGV
jgi:hypothetical protein